jgi:hypothetical protein
MLSDGLGCYQPSFYSWVSHPDSTATAAFDSYTGGKFLEKALGRGISYCFYSKKGVGLALSPPNINLMVILTSLLITVQTSCNNNKYT